MKNNAFSKHDNRHTIQHCGVYLGTGLGRRQFLDPKTNQHWSDSRNFTVGSQQKYTSTYTSGYRRLKEVKSKGRCSSASLLAPSQSYSRSQPVRRHSISVLETKRKPLDSSNRNGNTSSQIPVGTHSQTTKNSLHRFPRKYSLPKDMDWAKPSINTRWWHRVPEVSKTQSDSVLDVKEVPRFARQSGGLEGNYTPLSLIAATQQPLPKKNTWKY